jgi:lactate permease
MPWPQTYDPLGSPWLSTLAATIPLVVLLGCLGILRVKVYLAALYGLGAALLVAVWIYQEPVYLTGISAIYGAAYGLLPIGWIILNVLFLYQLANQKELFQVLQGSLTSITQDRRLQLLLVAFCLGAFFEGAAGFGTPVAVCASILIGLGFQPLAASVLSLIANTAPVPYAGLGTPLIALQAVTGLDLYALTQMVARQLFFFDILIPFWLVAVFAGWQGMLEIWPALLVTGGSYALVQLLVASLHGPWLVNILAALASMLVLVIFLRLWQPRHIWHFPAEQDQSGEKQKPAYSRRQMFSAWLPWLILSALVFAWGLPQTKSWMDSFSLVRLAVPGLHEQVLREPPVVVAAQPEAALFDFNWLSASGTAILIAAILAGLLMGYSPLGLVKAYWQTLRLTWQSLLTIAVTMAIGFVYRYGGLDGTLGIAFAHTGALYPFFGTLLGWLGVMLTGSDTSSNVLFGSLQRITAEQLGLNPVLMAAANSAGGVMGKMLNAQSLVVASSATRWHGHESDILRSVFWHSLALVGLVALLVLLEAYVPPFTWMVVR